MSNTLRVSNLPLQFDASMLEDMFTVIGNVRNARILMDAVSGLSRGLGLVEMSTEEEARDCIQFFHGQVKDDNTLVVRENTPHVPLPPVFKKAVRLSRERPKNSDLKSLKLLGFEIQELQNTSFLTQITLFSAVCGTPNHSRKEESLETFDELGMSPALQRAIQELGFIKPSPIQEQTLPILLNEDVDFIGLAATGTGKTAAFTLPLLQRVDAAKKSAQAIVLCPTRELSMQVAGQVNLIGKYMNIRALPIYGGAGYEEQLRGLKQGVSVIVGTPGRIIDHLERGSLKLNDIKTVVLDEADEMISMGFREDIEKILKGVPRENSKVWLFSATMSSVIRKVADQFLKAPKLVQVNRTEMLSSTVEQYYYMTQEKNKPEVLCKLIDSADNFYGLIFCQMKSLVVDLTRYLAERGYKVDALHGDMSQGAREATMLAFRQKRVKILVGTDVASRGLDVKDMSHVINYSLPRELDSYVHRIGRTARSGKTGLAMSLVTPSHRHLIGQIERLTKSKLKEGTIPSRKDIGTKKISQMLTPFSELPAPERALELMDESWKQAVSTMTGEEVAARFLALMFPWVFSAKEQPQMTSSHAAAKPKADGPRDHRRPKPGFHRGGKKMWGKDRRPVSRPDARPRP